MEELKLKWQQDANDSKSCFVKNKNGVRVFQIFDTSFANTPRFELIIDFENRSDFYDKNERIFDTQIKAKLAANVIYQTFIRI